MTGAELLLLLSIAGAFTGFGWYGRGIRRNLHDQVLARETAKLEAHCAKLKRTRDQLFDEVGQKRAELALLGWAGPPEIKIVLTAEQGAFVEELIAEKKRTELPTSSQGGNS